jgi:ribosomal-protein-alanine N-acetyltransferase
MEDDLDRIMRVMGEAFDPQYGEAWNMRQVSDSLLMGNCRYLLAGSDGQEPAPGEEVIGFAMSRRVADEEELLLLAVMPSMRNKGIGRKLIQRMIDDSSANNIRHIFLEMRRGNPAESLYKYFGFRTIGMRKDYYRQSNGERIDAITFGLRI